MALEPQEPINQRYRPVRLLGEGGMGSVYLVQDIVQADRPVALKILRPDALEPLAVERFKDEFRSMSRLRHPNLAEVFDFGSMAGDGRNFLTMEYVEGRDLSAFSWPALRPHFDDLVVQCLRALDYIHARGLLHNDIKPQNILVLSPFRVKILDFGLAQARTDPTLPGVSGTIHYVAPERLRHGRPDPRSDLYALGVVLYEILTGALPYQGEDAGEVVTAILQGRYQPPQALNPDLPERLSAFVTALLQHDPDDRPATASAALDLLNAGTETPHPLDTPETCASFVTSGRFVGRDDDLAILQDLVQAHLFDTTDTPDRPRLVVVSGAGGIGKSRLLRELKHRLQLAGVRNLTGRCYEDGGVPFQAFVEILRQLPRNGEIPAALRPILDQLAPAGHRPGDVAAADAASSSSATAPPPERIDKAEFITGLATSFDLLARGTPGILFLEDLHWSDGPGVELLEHLVFRPARGPWLLIVSLRDEESAAAPIGAFLKRFGSFQRLRRLPLRPLGAEQIAELLASMVPFAERPDELGRALAARTEGNPLYVEELMKSLTAEGTLHRSGGVWVAEPGSLDAVQRPATLAGLITQRLAGLTEEERALVEILSVFNRPAPIPILAAAAGRPVEAVAAALESLDRLRLATLERPADGIRLVSLPHSRIREAVYLGIPPERRAALHLAAGSAIEAAHRASPEDVVEDLAHHFIAGGDRERAATYCLRAAAKANALYNPQREVEYLTRALESIPAGDGGRRLQPLHDITERLTIDLGDYRRADEYARALHDEARRAGDASYEAVSLSLRSWAASFVGRDQEALEWARRGLAVARAAGDRFRIGRALNALGIVHSRCSGPREARPNFEEARAIFESLGHDAQTVNTMNNLALIHMSLGEHDTALTIQRRMLAMAKEKGLAYHYHRYLSNLGTMLSETGDLAGAIAALEEALAWAREHANLEMAGHVITSLGHLYPERGLFQTGLRVLEEELALRRQMRDLPSQIHLLEHVGILCREVGRPRLAEERHREALAIARDLPSRLQEGYVLASLATDRLESGGTDEAEELALLALEAARELEHPRITFLARSVLALAAARRPDRRALARAARALLAADSRPLRYYDRLRQNLVLGRCALAAGRPADAEREARAGLAAALKGGFREYEWKFQGLLGDALTAKKLAAAAHDAYNAGHFVIRNIAAELGEPQMRDDYEQDERKQEIRRVAESEVTVTTTQEPAVAPGPKGNPLKMLTTIYEITQIINSILDPRELLNKVMDLAIDIVGAERGLIFLYRSDTDEMEMVVARNIERQTIKDATEYSRSILKEAGRGRSILSHDAHTDARFKEYRSVAAYNIRSLLCVPLRIRERVIGTVYVDTRKPGVVFTQDDLRFLEAFANQAAIAIENARLYEKVQQENLYLKQAVQERYGYENIVGRSTRMREVFTLLSRVAPTQMAVLIRGESGTGKELVARAIHQNSPRKERKFYSENCAALPETLLESELFGHVKGSFTGADSTRKGLFELADGGTLFLDEVGDMSVSLQSKLLRAVEEGEIRPVGSETSRHVDVRLISATNRDLEEMIREKKFRQDLYFRLNGITVRLPALRERREDIPLLVDYFLGRLAKENGTPKLRVEPTLAATLSRYDWPGNVRELENQVYRLALFATGDTLTREDAEHDVEFLQKISPGGGRGVDSGITREDLERALSEARGNRDQAARILNISRATMFRKLKQFQVGKRQARAARRPQAN